jgi:hypothetical protein
LSRQKRFVACCITSIPPSVRRARIELSRPPRLS